MKCKICFRGLTDNKKAYNWNCGHYYHKKCASEYIKTVLSEDLVQEIRCPEPECQEILTTKQIQEGNLRIAKKYFEGDMWFQKLSGFIHCPYENCTDGKFLLPSEFSCRKCERKVCRLCLGTITSHKCFRKKIDVYKHCPSCNKEIVKRGGCDHVICAGCRANFDWKTLSLDEEVWNPPPTVNRRNAIVPGNAQQIFQCQECGLMCQDNSGICCICTNRDEMCTLCIIR